MIGSPHNGNFLGLMELLADFDPFLAEHIQKHANKGRGFVNYLSSTICDELVDFMGNSVLGTIVGNVKKAKYYSFTVDSTPDKSHVDQLTVCIRYLENSKPVERFLTFIEQTGHKGEEQASAVLDFFQSKRNQYRGLSWKII